MKKLSATFMLLLAGFLVMAQSGVEGKWKTIDDKTGKMKSIVEISVRNGKLYGKVVELAPGRDQNAICKECTGQQKGKKVVGMEIINGLAKDGNEWYLADGILDPESGKVYDCRLWAEGDLLQVRGYIGWLFRTQTWEKVK